MACRAVSDGDHRSHEHVELTPRFARRSGQPGFGIATLSSMSEPASDLALVHVAPVRKRVWTYVFDRNPEFVEPWWRPEQDPSNSCRWVSIRQGVNEVARCKYVLKDDPAYDEVVDILAIEVAVPLRRQGIGRRTLDLIREANPGRRLIALNDDAVSRGFWERVGWIREEPPEFFRFPGVERVTYVEPL